jgi:peptidyl-tRNA hydrolase, PTH1 family
MSKYLIVGLGNIGEEYRNTRHNIGFRVLDQLAEKNSVKFSVERLADRCTIKCKGKVLVLIKPSTYMNLSGKAINYWMQAEKISKENILVITDDLALPFGTVRMKGKGSDGGHNGLKSIQETIATVEYSRIRVGIGSNFIKGKQVNYVLGEWTDEENKFLPSILQHNCAMIEGFATMGLQLTMTNFNKNLIP